MFEFVRKVLFTGQLKMEKGKLQIFGEDIMIIPLWMFSYLSFAYPKEVYRYTTKGGYEFSKSIMEKFNIGPFELKDYLSEIFHFGGWGLIQYFDFNPKEKHAILRVKSRVAIKTLEKGRQKEPIDHVIRGFFAAASKIIFKDKSIECIEKQCIVQGKPVCEFVSAPLILLKKKYPKLVKSQM